MEKPNNPQRPLIVRGQVLQAGRPLHRAVVEIHDVAMRGRKSLGRVETDVDGSFELDYTRAQQCHPDAEQRSLQASVFDAKGRALGDSDLLYGAEPEAMLIVELAGEPVRSEYERILAAVTPLAGEVPLHALKQPDVAYLSGQTGFDAASVQNLADSARLGLESEVVPQSDYYALFRQNLPASSKELLDIDLSTIRVNFERSSRLGIVPAMSDAELDAAVGRFKQLKASSLGDLLKTSRMSSKARDIVAGLKVEHQDTPGDFRAALRDHPDLGPSDVAAAEATLDFGELTRGHLPLVAELQTRGGLRDLAGLDVSEWKAILQREQGDGRPIGVPSAIVADTEEERQTRYATELYRHVEKALPTLVLAKRLAKESSDDVPFEAVGDLRTFFDRNPDFDFGTTRIDEYLREDRAGKLDTIANPDGVTAELRRIQRVFNLTPRYDEIRLLRAGNLDSAGAILNLGPRRFLEEFGERLGDPERAKDVYGRAEDVHATALSLFMRHGKAAHTPMPYVMGGGEAPARVLINSGATWAGLFGSLDLCDCKHCKSLYSPAAYFVDVMQFLANGPLKDGRSPLEALLVRRPDLEYVALTCENTSTSMPYVDLVNEILEDAVSPREFELAEGPDIATVLADLRGGRMPASLATALAAHGFALSPDPPSVRPDRRLGVDQGAAWVVLDAPWVFFVKYQGTFEGFRIHAWPQTSWTAEELRATPEHVHHPAHAVLRRAVYPWNLPLNLPWEDMRAHLQLLGVPRADLMRTFYRGVPEAAWSEPAIASEYLGLSEDEAAIITGTTTGGAAANPGPWDFWGLADTGNDIIDPTAESAPHAIGTWDEVLRRVSICLRQSGLTYVELLEVLGTYFINPRIGSERTLGIRAAAGQDPTTCALSKLEIQPVSTTLSAAEADALLIDVWTRIHRFVRLARVLGWTFRDLDKAITAFAPRTNNQPDLTAAFLVQLSHVERLRAELDLPVPVLLSWWAQLDVDSYLDYEKDDTPPIPSLYDHLFKNPAAGQALSSDPGLAASASAIAAALQISADDFSLLTSSPRLTLPNGTLTRENLSTLHRHAALARALKISVRAHLSLLELVSADPFATTAETLRVVRAVASIQESGFSIDELDYVLRHQVAPGSNVAVTDEEIAEWLDALRAELRVIAADNTFVSAGVDPDAATSDPAGDRLRRKLAQLNWDAAPIDVVLAALNNTLTYRVDLTALPTGVTIPPALRDRLVYSAVERQLQFTGTMSAGERTAIGNVNTDTTFMDAVDLLLAMPKQIVARHLRQFSVPRLSATLDPKPTDLAIPEALARKCFYDTAAKAVVFVGVMTVDERAKLLRASGDTSYPAVVQQLFDAARTTTLDPTDTFLDAADAATLFDDPTTTPDVRILLVLENLLPALRARLSEAAVIQQIGEHLLLESTTSRALLTEWMNADSVAGERAIADFLDPAFAYASPEIPSSRLAFPSPFTSVALLHKVAAVVTKFKFTARQLRWVFTATHGMWLDLRALPVTPAGASHARYEAWARLLALSRLRAALPRGEDLLTEVFALSNGTGATLGPVLTALRTGTGWDPTTLRTLCDTSGFNLSVTDFRHEAALGRLVEAFSALRTLGAPVASCFTWTAASLSDATVVQAAIDVRGLVKAKLPRAQWLEAARTVNDPLRERLRSALVSYLVAQRGLRSANDLYARLLIDVEMGSCMVTTRLKQAISSVQLFVQRSLMNLDGDADVTRAEAREWSAWRKQYRVWEANRKILLYPENWIEPDLRDDKSPFFEELEDELLQNDLTAETAEDAFLHYLQKLEQVARLEVVGMYTQAEPNEAEILHVIGRTYATPHLYFYRRRELTGWTPWEAIDVDISGDHLMPVIWNRRLYLFWAVFVDKSDRLKDDEPPTNDSLVHWEIRMAWSERKAGGWTPKKLSSEYLELPRRGASEPFQAPSDYSFKTRKYQGPFGEYLAFECFGTVVKRSVTVASGPVVWQLLIGKVPAGDLSEFSFTMVSDPDSDIKLRGLGTQLDITIVAAPAGGSPAATKLVPAVRSVEVTYYLETVKYGIKSINHVRSDEVVGNNQFQTRHRFHVGLYERKKEDVPGTPQLPVYFDMMAVGRFAFDDALSDVRAASVLTAVPAMDTNPLEPLFGTRFTSMMMVESVEANAGDGLGAQRLLERTPGVYRVLARHDSYAPYWLPFPFFFQDDAHTYLATVENENSKARFHVFHYRAARGLLRVLNRFGVDGLLLLQNQRATDNGAVFLMYQPKVAMVDLSAGPIEEIDFDQQGSYAGYNWEVFFHIPFLIAVQLSKNQRFEEAQKWFHYIFDPTATDSPAQPAQPGIERFWRVKPFYDTALGGIQTLTDLVAEATALKDQVGQWRTNPFRPHAIARLRPVAYMKTVVMHYIDNLIAWGDQLFRRETIEAINEATQLYVLAAEVLGKRPERIPPRARPQAQVYRTLDDFQAVDSLSNALVGIETFLPPSLPPAPAAGGQTGAPLKMPFFCLSANDKLLGYWDTVADRLFKIRHCMNIEGVERTLPTFEPEIDPALLVRAIAAGVDLSSVLNDMNAPVPPYRFGVMAQKAMDLCNELSALGDGLLAAMEKRDAEGLALLRATHEIGLLKAVRLVKQHQREEAEQAADALRRSQDVVTARRQYYLTRPFINELETQSLAMTVASLVPTSMQAGADIAAAVLHLIPNTKAGMQTTAGTTFGGSNVGSALQAFGGANAAFASLMSTGASLSATLGGYQRRQDDWAHQADLATKELEQIKKQIAAADIRVAIGARDLENHDLQVENAKAAHELMKEKFTNQQLYSWMVGQISGIYFQSYQLAYDVAKRAERAYRHELGLKDSNFIQFGYWDSLKKGLLAGDRLRHDLRRMDVSFLDLNKREYEITKHVSLNALDPISVIRLKRNQDCFITLPEALFDLDYPGHYLRRLKSVSVTIPCVAGPYASVNCTLTQLGSSIRYGNNLNNGRYGRVEDDRRFTDTMGTTQAIVTSNAQNDSGLFEANVRDERFLPFEGRGVVSNWRLELPKRFPAIDYETIADVILHVRYTAREGGGLLRTKASDELAAAVNAVVQSADQRGLARAMSLRHEFPSDFHRLLNPPAGQTGNQRMTIGIDKARFPFLVQGRNIQVTRIEAFVKVRESFVGTYTADTFRLSLQPGSTASSTPITLTTWNGLLRGERAPAGTLGPWTLAIWEDTDPDPGTEAPALVDANAIEDIVLVCHYTV